MGLLDWLKGARRGGGEAGPRDTQEERLEAQRQEQGGTFPEGSQDIGETPLERRDEEAGRHSGI